MPSGKAIPHDSITASYGQKSHMTSIKPMSIIPSSRTETQTSGQIIDSMVNSFGEIFIPCIMIVHNTENTKAHIVLGIPGS